jgi:hypothetical protein
MLRPIYNIYCDESCHLQHDQIPVMVFGALWLPQNKKREIFQRLKEIRQKHDFPSTFEFKWHKVSMAKLEFYKELIDYFFDDDDLHFRVLIVPDKTKLEHERYSQSHDQFYYKMYFDLLKVIMDPSSSYEIYLDKKDSQGWEKVKTLENILRTNHYDYSRQVIKKVQQVDSSEIITMHLTDLLTGAVAYANRHLSSNAAKVELVNRVKKRSGYNLSQSTLLKESKFNIFRWRANYGSI